MRRLLASTFICIIVAAFVVMLVPAQQGNQPPFVSNIRAVQRPGTKLVDISYDVEDPNGDGLTISIAVSDDDGNSFDVPAHSLTGDIGAGIAPGTGKLVVWDAGVDVPNVFGTYYRVRVTASDGQVGISTITGNDGAPMAFISAGAFQMGDASSAESDERPAHTVYVDAFYMDVYEVTVGQYERFVQATGHTSPNWGQVRFYSPTDTHPMVIVNWHDAAAYCAWAGKRLPTEAEWEKAARGRLVDRTYPWGDEAPNADGLWRANYSYGGNGLLDGYGYCAPVGSFHANGYGLYDMAGNALEWCADWYNSGYYATSPVQNPQGPGSGGARVLRGGSFQSYSLRVADRNSLSPTRADSVPGFRCVQDF